MSWMSCKVLESIFFKGDQLVDIIEIDKLNDDDSGDEGKDENANNDAYFEVFYFFFGGHDYIFVFLVKICLLDGDRYFFSWFLLLMNLVDLNIVKLFIFKFIEHQLNFFPVLNNPGNLMVVELDNDVHHILHFLKITIHFKRHIEWYDDDDQGE